MIKLHIFFKSLQNLLTHIKNGNFQHILDRLISILRSKGFDNLYYRYQHIKWVKNVRIDPFFIEAKNEQYKVSIILPTKNRKAILSKAIDSVLNQSFSNWELIIVDDGSTDGTIEYVKKHYNDHRISISTNIGKGVSAARNYGLESATGHAIMYLDSDNVWTKDYVLYSLYALIKNDFNLHYSVLKMNNGKLNYRYLFQPFDIQKLINQNFIDLNIFSHGIKVYKSLGGFDESLKRLVDWDLIIKFSKEYPVTYSPFIGAIYDNRKREDRISVKEDLETAKQTIRNKYS